MIRLACLALLSLLSSSALAAAPTPTPAATPQKLEAPAPPGMVLIEGGRTKIGVKLKDLQKEVEESETAWRYARVMSDQFPQYTAVVPDFYLMINEVTNEQYAVFVRTTGHRPPQHWGEKALQEAQMRYLQEEGRKREEARKAGEPIPERKSFDRPAWWSKNWQGQEWEIPEGLEHHPVVFVDYQDAEAYCRWAGLRLMSEEEYQRSVRGDSDRFYPWGEEWKHPGYALTNVVSSVNAAYPAGSFPQGASKQGVVDLIGNVWEWTSTPYRSYEGWKMAEYERGRGNSRETKQGVIAWDPNDRVCVGGSFQNEPLAARCTMRLQVERFQNTDALGFRCAASPRIGFDAAGRAYREIKPQARPKGPDGPIAFDTERTVALDRWKASTPSASAQGSQGIATPEPAQKKKGKKASGTDAEIPPPGYAVIEGYEYALFTPVDKLFGATQSDLEKTTVEEAPATVGYFSTNQTLIGPKLEPGTYLVSFRGPGEPRKRRRQAEGEEEGEEGEAAAAEEEEEGPADAVAVLAKLVESTGLDPKVPNLIFYDVTGAPVLAVPFDRGDTLEYSTAKPSEVSKFMKTIYFMTTNEEGEEVEASREEEWMRFRVCIPGRSPRKGFFVNLDFKFDAEAMGGGWRMSK